MGDNVPPFTGAGVHRVLGWMRYLPQNGWDVIILGLPNDYWPPVRRDPELAKSIDEDRIIRPAPLLHRRISIIDASEDTSGTTGSRSKDAAIEIARRIKRYILLPDTRILWVPRAIRAVEHLHRQRPIHAVLTTSPENSNHLVGASLRRRLGVPWVADLRDPWPSTWELHASEIHAKMQGRIARSVLTKADRVTVVSPLLRRHSIETLGLRSDRVTVIWHGTEDVEGLSEPPPDRSRDRISIAHTGKMYSRRSPLPILEAIAADDDLQRRVRLRFLGEWDRETYRQVVARSGSSWLEILPPSGHRDALMEQRTADALLLIPGEGSQTVPSKTFEYLATGKPILALCSETSDTADLLRKFPTAIVVDPQDLQAIRQALRSLLSTGERYRPRDHFWESLSRYTRSSLVREMAGVLTDALGESA